MQRPAILATCGRRFALRRRPATTLHHNAVRSLGRKDSRWRLRCRWPAHFTPLADHASAHSSQPIDLISSTRCFSSPIPIRPA